MKTIFITGNVGKDAERKITQSGDVLYTFSVGVNVGKNKPDWVDVILNDRIGNKIAQYITKGKKVLVTGFPSVSAYINKDNKAVAIQRINASNIEFLSANDKEEFKYEAPTINHETLKSDEIPF